MRRPSKPQVVFAVESHMDMVAQELGLDAYKFRLKNVMRDGDASQVGHHWQKIKAVETLEATANAVGIDTPKPANTGRGMAMTDLVQGTGRFEANLGLSGEGRPLNCTWPSGTRAPVLTRCCGRWWPRN